MPRSVRVVAILLLALVPLLALPTRAAVPTATEPIGPGDVYLALGDSLPAGFEVTDDGQPGYPTPLHAELVRLQPGITLTNLGRAQATSGGGETSSTFVAPGGQLEQAVAFIGAQRAAGKVVSPVTLSIGGNDAVGVILPGSTITLTQALTLYRTNLEAALDALVGALTEEGARTGDLLIQNLYNAYPGLADDPTCVFFLGDVDPDRDLPLFNQIVAEEAAERGITVIDVFTVFQGREAEYIYARQDLPDRCAVPLNELAATLDFHPRPAGHQAMATAYLAASGYNNSQVYVPLVGR